MYINIMSKIKSIVGQQFERWKVISFDRIKPNHGAYFVCQCQCGTIRSVLAKSLKEKRSKSCGCIQKLKKGEASCRSVYRSYKRDAFTRGYSFSLTIEEFKKITKQNCYYCNSSPQNCHKNIAKYYNGVYTYNGIDRKDNKLGYTAENCVACCNLCNKMKGTKTVNEFIEHCHKIIQHYI